MSETRILRERQSAARAARRGCVPFAEDGAVAVLAQTRVVASYPTVPAAFYACSPLLVDGPETEGAAATFTEDGTRTIYAFNLGTRSLPWAPGSSPMPAAAAGRFAMTGRRHLPEKVIPDPETP